MRGGRPPRLSVGAPTRDVSKPERGEKDHLLEIPQRISAHVTSVYWLCKLLRPQKASCGIPTENDVERFRGPLQNHAAQLVLPCPGSYHFSWAEK